MVLQQPLKIIKILWFLFLVILLAGCQEEYIEITEPDKNIAFSASDTLADLILKVTLKDGSFDNIIDNCSEISIIFPYSVQIRNEIITISSRDDIESFKQEYFPIRGTILVKYPVRISFSDYSEKVLSNRGELQKIHNQYNTGIEDDDIECIDFIYPIELSVYNTEFQKPDFIIAGNDKDLHGVLKNMDDLIIEISYPIPVEISDGTRINIQNNKELENEIMNAMGSCDEEDEVDIGNDDIDDDSDDGEDDDNSDNENDTGGDG